MRNEQRFFLHGFSNLDNIPFQPADYSKLKFGSDSIAKEFGYKLADGFFAAHSEMLLKTQSVVIPSPYNYIRNAATVMSEHFVDRLNHLLINNGGHNVEWSVIHRKVSYINDYGFLDKEKRKELINGDVFHINKGFIEGKNIILIDDVCITGTHEEKLIDILNENDIHNNTFFLYFAKYVNGTVGADIEAALNFSGIKTLEDFVQLTKEPNHNLIVRPIKFLMNQKHVDFVRIIDEFDHTFIQKLYYGCLGEGYHKIDSYKKNFKLLSQHRAVLGEPTMKIQVGLESIPVQV
jgi:hypothetical protein